MKSRQAKKIVLNFAGGLNHKAGTFRAAIVASNRAYDRQPGRKAAREAAELRIRKELFPKEFSDAR